MANPLAQATVATPEYLSLTCLSRVEETQDAATFYFTLNDGNSLNYRPGQFISVNIVVDGQSHRRAYTLSSSPSRSESLAITVKRVDSGLVSNYLLDHLQAGMEIQALPPGGLFYYEPAKVQPRLLMVSAGSGITPMLSMSRYLLDTNADVSIHFIHCARSYQDVICRDELQQMANSKPQFKLDLMLSDQSHPDYHFGLLDEAKLKQLVDDWQATSLFTCGPAPFMQMVRNSAERNGLNMHNFFQESFESPTLVANPEQGIEPSPQGELAQYKVQLPAFNKSAMVNSGDLLLDALEEQGLPIIAACRSGVCGSCKCKVTQGKADASGQLVLPEAEREAGFVLACSTKVEDNLTVELG